MRVQNMSGQRILSIHDLTRRSTYGHIELYIGGGPFNSRPHKEVDWAKKGFDPNGNLSIHDLTRRSTSCVYHAVTGGFPFNSRPHKEVDISDVVNKIIATTFQFTTSQGGRHALNGLFLLDDTFQFTTSQGGRRLFATFFDAAFPLSIHDLTRRSTQLRSMFRGVTSPFNSRPHKEVDRVNRLPIRLARPFNSRPHKEVDSTGMSPCRYILTFQFTTSQGGRHGIDTPTVSAVSFNSRPHKEVDPCQSR